MTGDEFTMHFPKTNLQDAVKGDRKTQLEAIRDYIAHELESHRCNTCANSRLRTGDQASLILRLQTVLEAIEALPNETEVTGLDSLRLRVVGTSDTEDQPLSGSGAARRTGTRRVGPDNRGRASGD